MSYCAPYVCVELQSLFHIYPETVKTSFIYASTAEQN